ncbi:MAG: JAB domain-containing protein [Acidobacteriota bacterium]|nr:JAB domain-containing protein [Acidobacteriota bacterium]
MHRPDPFGPARKHLCPGLALLADTRARLVRILSAAAVPEIEALADRLAARFGSVTEAVWASPAALEAVDIPEPVIAYFGILKETAVWMDEECLPKRLCLDAPEAVGAYCRKALAGEEAKQCWGLFLNRRMALLGKERLALGSVDHIKIYRREIAKDALLKYNASRIILVLNDPSGDLVLPDEFPSSFTEIGRTMNLLGIPLVDIILVAREGWRSLKQDGCWPPAF